MCKNSLDIKGIYSDIYETISKGKRNILTSNVGAGVYITLDGKACYLLSKYDFFIDDSKIGYTDLLGTIVKKLDNASEIKVKSYLPKDERGYKKIEFDNNSWVDTKVLKRFPTDAVYKQDDTDGRGIEPIFIFAKATGEFCGFVMPLRNPDKSKK